jgi:WD40 repeat protein
VRALACGPGGFAAGGADGQLWWWDGEADRIIVIDRLRGPVAAVAVSPEGRYLVAGGDPAPAGILDEPRLWDLAHGTSIPLRGHHAAVTALAYTLDGTRVATASADGAVRLYAAPTGALERTLTRARAPGQPAPAATTTCFAPDGTQLFVGYADGVGRLFALPPTAASPR